MPDAASSPAPLESNSTPGVQPPLAAPGAPPPWWQSRAVQAAAVSLLGLALSRWASTEELGLVVAAAAALATIIRRARLGVPLPAAPTLPIEPYVPQPAAVRQPPPLVPLILLCALGLSFSGCATAGRVFRTNVESVEIGATAAGFTGQVHFREPDAKTVKPVSGCQVLKLSGAARSASRSCLPRLLSPVSAAGVSFSDRIGRIKRMDGISPKSSNPPNPENPVQAVQRRVWQNRPPSLRAPDDVPESWRRTLYHGPAVIAPIWDEPLIVLRTPAFAFGSSPVLP